MSWPDGTKIELECSKGRGAVSADPSPVPNAEYVEHEVDPDADTRRDIPALCWREDTPVLFERLQLRENTDYLLDAVLPISRTEAEEAIAKNPAWPFARRLAAVVEIDPPKRWRPGENGTLLVSGRLRLRNHAGIIDLTLPTGGQVTAEVVCRKIGYLEEFRALLDAVADEVAELLLQYDSPTSASFDLVDLDPKTSAGILFQLRHVMAPDNLPVALDQIRHNVHSRLIQQTVQRDIQEVEAPDVPTFVDELDTSRIARGGPFRALFRGYSPLQFPESIAVDSIDTAENRYVRHVLQELVRLCRSLQATLRGMMRPASLAEVDSWIETLEEELAQDLWRQVGELTGYPSGSQVLQKRAGYREILRLDAALRMSMQLPWKPAASLATGLVGDLRPVSELYEYWCFFVLRRCLAGLATPLTGQGKTIVEPSHEGFQLRLVKGHRSRSCYRYQRHGSPPIEVNLYYNRSFRRSPKGLSIWHGSYTANFHPDYSVEIVAQTPAGPQRHWLHFDAKYRLDPGQSLPFDLELSEEVEEAEASAASVEYETELRVHRRDDLFKMHTYRDGILGSRGAYILFPGTGVGLRTDSSPNIFVRHPDGADLADRMFPSVGALDLVPGDFRGQEAALRDFLQSILDATSSSAPYQEETGFS